MTTVKNIKYIPIEKLIIDSYEEINEYEEDEIELYESLLYDLKTKNLNKLLDTLFLIDLKFKSDLCDISLFNKKYREKFKVKVSKIYKEKKKEIDKSFDILDEFKFFKIKI